MGELIPKCIHQIWLGGEPPSEILSWMDGWKDLHPDWDYRLWTDQDAAEAVNIVQYQAADSYAAKADVLRVDILAKYGGVYIDADYSARRRIDSLVADRSAVLLSEGPYLTNSFMAFAPEHPLINLFQMEIGSLTEAELRSAGDQVLTKTGPIALTRVTAENSSLLADARVVMLAPDYFLVPKTRNSEILELSAARRFGTHHAAATWRSSNTLSGLIRGTRLRTRIRRFFDLSAP